MKRSERIFLSVVVGLVAWAVVAWTLLALCASGQDFGPFYPVVFFNGTNALQNAYTTNSTAGADAHMEGVMASSGTAATATTALNWAQVMPTTNANQIVIYTNTPGQVIPPNVIATYTYCLTNAVVGYALYTNNLPINTNAICYFPSFDPQPWALAPSNEIAQAFQDTISFYFFPTGMTIVGPWTESTGEYPTTTLYASNTFSANENGSVQYANTAGYAVTAGISALSSNAMVASSVFGPVVDLTNFNTAEWIVNVGSRINEFQSVGRYSWTNTLNDLTAGQHQLVVENDGCGYGFEYVFGLIDLLFQNNNVPFAGAIVSTGSFPLNGGQFYYTEFKPHFGPVLAGTPGGFHDASQQYFCNPPLDGICVTNGGTLTITNNSWPWNVCIWSYYTSPDGGGFSVQTNNLAASGTWTQVASGTSLASTTNLVFGAWTNAAGASTNVMFRFVETGGVGTNRTEFFGYLNTNLSNGIVYQQVQSVSMSVANMLTGSTFAMTNTEKALWAFSTPTLDIYNDANGDTATNLWPAWFTFVKSQIPPAGDIVAVESYLASNGIQTQGNTNNFITLRQDSINAHIAFFDGMNPCVSTNLLWYYGLNLNGNMNDWHEDSLMFRPSSYWFYKWMNLQDSF